MGRAPELALPVGVTIDAELTLYPGGGLRADLGRQFAPPAAPPGTPVPDSPPPGGSTAAALAAYGEALRGDPWLDAWPVTLRDVIPVPSEGGWQLADAESASALPLSSAALSRPGLWKLVALSGGGPVTVFGELGHRGFDPFAAWETGVREVGAVPGPVPRPLPLRSPTGPYGSSDLASHRPPPLADHPSPPPTADPPRTP